MKIIRCHTLILILLVTCGLPHSIVAADKLRIGYGAPSVAMATLWITKEGKLFEKNGLDVEVLYLESALVQRALIAGNIIYGEMTGSLMAAPKLQGADLTMVAGFLNQLIYRLVARPEIKALADLKGKRVGSVSLRRRRRSGDEIFIDEARLQSGKRCRARTGGRRADQIGGIGGQFDRCDPGRAAGS